VKELSASPLLCFFFHFLGKSIDMLTAGTVADPSLLFVLNFLVLPAFGLTKEPSKQTVSVSSFLVFVVVSFDLQRHGGRNDQASPLFFCFFCSANLLSEGTVGFPSALLLLIFNFLGKIDQHANHRNRCQSFPFIFWCKELHLMQEKK